MNILFGTGRIMAHYSVPLMAHKDVQVLIPQTCEYVMPYDKGELRLLLS